MTPVRLEPAALGLKSSTLPLSHCAPNKLLIHVLGIYSTTLKKTKNCFLRMQIKRIAECFKWSILQYFRPSLSYQLFLSIFEWPFFSGFTVIRMSAKRISDYFVWRVLMHYAQSTFCSHVGTFDRFPGLNETKCLSQHSASGESRTSGPSTRSQALYY